MRNIWIISVLFSFVISCTPRNSNEDHFVNAINLYLKSVDISNTGTPNTPPTSMMQRLKDLRRESLDEAKQVDINDLNKYFPGMGTHFSSEFVVGL